jgi:hypothetical protein
MWICVSVCEYLALWCDKVTVHEIIDFSSMSLMMLPLGRYLKYSAGSLQLFEVREPCCLTLSGRMISERTGYVKGSSQGPIWGTAPTCAWSK